MTWALGIALLISTVVLLRGTGQSAWPRWRPRQTPDRSADIFAALLPWAPSVAARFGLHPAVLFAQAALEAGSSTTMRAANALWGVKVGSYTQAEAQERAERIRLESGLPVQPFSSAEWRTHEVRNGEQVSTSAGFRVYPNLLSGAADYADLVTRGRYELTRETADPYRQVAAIWGRGYATSERYLRSVSGLLEQLTGTERPAWIEDFIDEVLEARAAGRDTTDLVRRMVRR